ncbi:O-antigen polymerase [Butyrivibrio sp. AE3009]|uniref:O-antigen polymerase n=1 Tax=Butyrivibrio sp. AE3009 TaxID=1280666 RepID=UPI0003B5C59D|nr:O-antigen polymerase [Butyrivibrio sp. AE3009]
MELLAIAILGVHFIVVLTLSRFRINMIVSFNGMWFIMALLRWLNLCNFYEIEIRTYWILVLGVVCFNIGYILLFRLRGISFVGIKIESRSVVNEPILFGVMIVHTVINIIYASRMVPFILSGYSLGQIRAIFQGYDDSVRFYTGQGMHRAWSYFVSPWIMVFTCVIIYSLFSKRRFRISVYVLYIVDMVAYMLYTASRATIFNIMIFAFVYFFVYFDEINQKKKFYFYIAIFMILAIVLILTYMSFGNRKVGVYKAFKGLGSLYVYASGPISLLDMFIKDADKREITTYGAAAFYPIIRIINAFRVVLGMKKSDICLFVEKILNQKEVFRYVAPKVYFNAYGTLFYELYLDFRWVGIIVGCIFYGGMTYRIEQVWFKRKDSERKMILGGLFAVSFVYSIVRWHFSFMPYILCFIYAFFLCNRIKFTITNNS